MTNNTLHVKKSVFSDIEKHFDTCQDYYRQIIRFSSYEDLQDVVDLHLKFIESAAMMTKLIEDYAKELSEEEMKKAHSNESTLYYCDQRLNLHVASLVAKSNKHVTKESRKGLINQLSIFSMFLTILTFVLNNAKLFAMENIGFAMIMAGNVSFILMCVVMFSMIYIFLHLDDRKEVWWKRILRAFTIIGFIVVLSVLIFMLVRYSDNMGYADPKKLLTLIAQKHP